MMTEVSEAAKAFEYKPVINFNEDQKSVCTSPELLQNTQCVNNPVTLSIQRSPELMLLFWRVTANVKTTFPSFAEEEPVTRIF